MHLRPIQSGLGALQKVRAGVFDIVTSVGHPPVLAALAAKAPINVIWAESYDALQLIVDDKIDQIGDLKGKTIAVLLGSSDVYELRGWLKENGLLGDVELLELSSYPAIGAAWKSGRVPAAYVDVSVATQLKDQGGREITNAVEIADLGYASLNVVVVFEEFENKYPKAVQGYVCATVDAMKIIQSGDNEEYISRSAHFIGQKPQEAIQVTALRDYVPVSKQLEWFVEPGKLAESKLVDTYMRVADYLESIQVLRQAPSKSTIVEHIHPQYVRKAITTDVCDNYS